MFYNLRSLWLYCINCSRKKKQSFKQETRSSIVREWVKGVGVLSDDNISLSSQVFWLMDSHKIRLWITTLTVCTSLNATRTQTHTHTHTQKPSVLSAWDLEMGAEACALVWRPDRVEAHTFGLRGALRTPELRGIKRAGWRSTTVLWTPLTRWRVMVENTDERKTSLVFQWKTIYTGSFSVPSGIKYAAMPHCHCSEETVTWPMLVVEPDGPGVWVRMCLGSLIAPVQVDSRIVRAC